MSTQGRMGRVDTVGKAGSDRDRLASGIGRRSLLAGAGALTGLAGCSTPTRGPAVPSDLVARATALGLPNERFNVFSPTVANDFMREFQALIVQRQRAGGHGPNWLPAQFRMLAVSGGAENGAFGAGILCGWTEQGSRPTFDWVTGVSTGALTAPFAFLGSKYDPVLREVFTQISLKDVLIQRHFSAALFDDALTDTSPLFATISRHLNETMLADLARAYKEEGRILLIGSTNLDSQTPSIWNIGAIAASGHPRSLELIRKILLASASIPGAFPPVMIDVTADGQPFQELHVDGGAFAQSFLYPPSLGAMRRARLQQGTGILDMEAFVIRNGRIDPEWATTERQMLEIAGRAIQTMIMASGLNDVVRMYFSTQRDRIGFNLAVIGKDFDLQLKSPFEQSYMRALFDHGYRQGRAGYPWVKAMPL